MKFIEKLNLNVDIDQAKQDLSTILSLCPWPERTVVDGQIYPANQLGLTHRPNTANPWIDAGGSLVDPKTGTVYGKESDFSVLNPQVPVYTKQILDQLAMHEGVSFGRIRFMRLMPKTGLTIHADSEARYHLVYETNKGALFGHYTGEDPEVAKCYHIPADGHFYKVDTRLPHFVYNGGWEPRVHLVICEA